MSITLNESGVMESVRESQEGPNIIDHLTDYDEAYESFRNVF